MSSLELINRNESVLEQFAAALDAEDWKYTKTGERIEFHFPAGPCLARGAAYVSGKGRYLFFFVSFGLLIPEDKRTDALTLLNRLNWMRAVANYEMDEIDGEIRIRTTYPVVNGQFDANRAVETMFSLCASADNDVDKFMALLSSRPDADVN